ncbi:hypothetical protein FH972_026040 [Carpinus fangiana]|uniref:RNA polymerase I-specific transcription initiation factor RRN3 n=1 Tax=Carpinus fangiana TaxID=176857 RepID=A0A5N6L3R9_9ROSI|nr:hypothetical protein FH972_026040 [Carpinus fangiana]
MSILKSTASAAHAAAPLLKSALKQKRKYADLSSDDLQSFSHSQDSKRPKIDFDSEVKTYFYDASGEDSAAYVQANIKKALKDHSNGNDDEYHSIKAIFLAIPYSEDAPSTTLLQKHLIGLSNNAASLNRGCGDLVNAIIDTQWLGQEHRTIALYVRFLGSLVSSQSGWITTILRMLVGNFASPSASAGRTTSHTQIDRKQLYMRVHEATKYILNLVPSSSGSLASILASSFPAPTDSRKAHVEYVKNVLRLTEYAPELKADALDLITERLIKIDVQVQVDVEDLDDMVSDLLVQGGLDDAKTFDEDDASDTESLSSDDSLDPEEERIEALKGAVQKMDAIMDLLFDYYTPSFDKGSQSDSRRLFNQMLAQFRKTVLPTFRSRHTQFLLFHFAQQSPDLVTSYVDSCMQILTDKARSAVLRSASAAYIASFVARGSLVSSDVVAYVFDTLATYTEKLRKQYEHGCRGPDLRLYTPYYATVQAMIYIFCFRWRDLLNDPEDFEEDEDDFNGRDLVWAPGVKEAFQQNFTSKLNPLKICVPEIVDQFARIAHHLQFLYIYQIIESNKRIRLSTTSRISAAGSRDTSLSSLHGERFHQLDAYFPFDPYQLPLSKKWLANDYNEWKGVPGLHETLPVEDVEEEQDSSDGEDEDLLVVDEGTETPDDASDA